LESVSVNSPKQAGEVIQKSEQAPIETRKELAKVAYVYSEGTAHDIC